MVEEENEKMGMIGLRRRRERKRGGVKGGQMVE
jgi:hypothetical protein